MRNDLTRFAAGAALALFAACKPAEPAARPGADSGATASASPAGPALLAYVTNEDSQELTIIDTRSDSAVASFPVGTRPRGVHVTPDGKTVFVALSGSPRCPPTMPDAECEKLKADKSKDGIAVVDAASRKVTRVLPGGSDPETFDISQDGSTLYVSNEDAGTASIVDVASGKIRSTVKVGREPEGVRVRPDGATVWVTGETDHNVTILDTKTGKIVGQIEVGKRPRSIAFTPDGSRAYVPSEVDGTVWVIDVATRKPLKLITMPQGSKPMDSQVSPDGKARLRLERTGRHGLGDRRRHRFGLRVGAGRAAAVGRRGDAGRTEALHRQRAVQRRERGRRGPPHGAARRFPSGGSRGAWRSAQAP